MKTMVKVTNLIQGGNKSLSHSKFQAFLEAMDVTYRGLTPAFQGEMVKHRKMFGMIFYIEKWNSHSFE
jgi:hypothetical protein